jgi:hypothetical protein
VGIIGNLLIGPYELLPQLSEASYLNFVDGRITSTTGGCTIGNGLCMMNAILILLVT